jgi:nucleoside-diphosphate-sugar epimerase
LKICIIGGNGFIGAELASSLRANGNDVFVMSRNPTKVSQENIKSDFFDFEQVSSDISKFKPDILICAAWITEKSTYRSSTLNEKYRNATINLGFVALRYNVKRMIVLGTCAEYGDNNSECVAGSSELKPHDFYAQMKISAYKELRSIFKGQDENLTWARVFQPYGKDQDPTRFIPYLANELRANRTPTISRPLAFSDWISTRDIAAAILFSLSADLPQAIDLGTGISTSNWELAKMVAKSLGKEKLLESTHIPANMGSPQGLVVGLNSPLFAKGWRSNDTLDSGLKWALDI